MYIQDILIMDYDYGCQIAICLLYNFNIMSSLSCWSDHVVGCPDCVGAAWGRAASMAAVSLLTPLGEL
jgi:hypothetical protein